MLHIESCIQYLFCVFVWFCVFLSDFPFLLRVFVFYDFVFHKKLSRYVDKENARSITTVQTIQTSKNYSVADKRGKAYGQQTEIQIQENAQPLRDKINNSPRRYSEMTRDEFQKKIPLAQSEYLPQTQPQAYPQRSASLGNRVSAPFQLNQNDISITVTNPERRGNAVHKNTYYNLQGSDKDGPFQITRSHDDFLKIRHVLVKRWPGCYVPSVPPKRVLTKVDEKFLEGRRKELEMFAQKMTELPHLHYSREYQLFLRSTNPDFDTDMAPFQAVSYDDIINRYKSIFKQPLQLRATPEAEKKIQDFKEFLQTVHSNFKSFKKVLKKTVAARKGYYEQLLQFHQIMSSGYETSVLSKLEKNPETNKVYSSEHGDLDSKVEGVKQAGEFGSIEYLHAWMKAENREISAFLEAIHKKEEYDDKRVKATQKWSSTTRSLERAMSGKRSLGAILTFKTSDQEVSNLEGKAVYQDKEQKQLQLLFDYIVLILAHSEIDRFKQRKTEQYHHVVNLAAQYELENLKNLTEYWSTILTIDAGIDKGSVISEN